MRTYWKVRLSMTKELVFHEEFPYIARVLKDKMLDPLALSTFRDELITVHNWKLEDYREFEGFLKSERFVYAHSFLSDILKHVKTLRLRNQTRLDYNPNTPSSRLVSELEYILGGSDE